MNRIYLDNAATTKMDDKVIKVMQDAFTFFGNPSSIHTVGQEARKIVDDAREFTAFFLDCKPTEVIFTSGGSESDNLAIRGVVDAWHGRNKIQETSYKQISNNKSQITNKSQAPNLKLTTDNCELTTPHIITTAMEHHAVLHTIQDLEKEGKVEATYIKPNKNGIVQVKDIEDAIKPNTILVSVMYVNNETGCVQPIREIGKLIERINFRSSKGNVASHACRQAGSKDNDNSKSHPTGDQPEADNSQKINSSILITDNQQLITERKSKIFFHTDAVQAAEFFEMGINYLHVDLLTLTAHKIHGPKGTGVLFVKKGTPISAQITGGDHEFGLRAGTENVAGIAGLCKSLELIIRRRADEGNKGDLETDPAYPIFQDETAIKVRKLRDRLEDFILKNIPDTFVNGDKELRSPHITNISFKNAEGEAIILNLDFLGISVSSGSACTARSLESSHVLTAMDIPHELTHGAIRFSLSRDTTEEEIDKVCEVLPGIIRKLRQMSPFK